MVTINPARYFGLRAWGGIAPGHMADLVAVENLEGFECRQVWAAGRLAAEEGVCVADLPPYADPAEALRSVRLTSGGVLGLLRPGRSSK